VTAGSIRAARRAGNRDATRAPDDQSDDRHEGDLPGLAYADAVRIVVVGLLMGTSLLVDAQPRTPALLRVGDARINARALQPYKVRWKETLVDPVHQVIDRGVRDDHLQRETIDGRPVLVRTVVASAPDGSVRESMRIVGDGATFAPVRTEWRGGGRSFEFDFQGQNIAGVRINDPGASPVKIAGSVWQPAFDCYGGMMDLFLATLPRQVGVYSFPAMVVTAGAGAAADGLDWPLVESLGDDVARGAGKVIKAWRVEANTPYGFYKVWVTDLPPYVVRTVILQGPGTRITYELL
jgi:hypothetical protein